MTGLQIVQQGRDADLLVILITGEVVDGEIDDGKKSIGVHVVELTGLLHRSVTETQVDAKGA